MKCLDVFEAPDYYNLDDLLSEEHKLVREAARDWVKRDVTPIIETYAQKAEFPKQILSGLAEIGALDPTSQKNMEGRDWIKLLMV